MYGAVFRRSVFYVRRGAVCSTHADTYLAQCSCPPLISYVLPFVYSAQYPENLLIFAAGNDGDVDDGRKVCTLSNPAIGKNALAVGATASGETRLGTTGADGEEADGTNGVADVDTVASFSSYGLTNDGRIKPEVVAPGDAVSTLPLPSMKCACPQQYDAELFSRSDRGRCSYCNHAC